jgi:hypothetical protein
MIRALFAIGIIFGLCFGCLPHRGEGVKYAELRKSSAERAQLLIESDTWERFISSEGFGGRRVDIHVSAILNGRGPVFQNPIIHINAAEPFHEHRGTITLDTKSSTVTIALQTVLSKPGEPLQTSQSPINGVYPIKKISSKAFDKRLSKS